MKSSNSILNRRQHLLSSIVKTSQNRKSEISLIQPYLTLSTLVLTGSLCMAQLSYPHDFFSFFKIKCCWIKVLWSRYNFPLSLKAAILLTLSDLTILTQLAIAGIDPDIFWSGTKLEKSLKNQKKTRTKIDPFPNFLNHVQKNQNSFLKKYSGIGYLPPIPLLRS